MRAFSSAPVRKAISQSRESAQTELVFPGSVKSQFTHELSFDRPADHPTMKTYRVFDINGNQVDESYELPFTQEQAVKMYRDMVTISIMDTIMYDAQRQGRFSFYMMSAGEEGASVGSAAALEPQDQVLAQYREQAMFYHRGMSLKAMMAQCYANMYDEGNGINMPMHFQSKELNIHPISSVLATQIPHAAGAAYAMKMLGQQACSIVYFGEGAASEGEFHAALNIAATRNCPTIFFCRNNGFAISTPSLEQYKGDGIASRGVGYGIDTIRVDGNDIAAVHRATKEARQLAIENQKPVLIEAMLYRISHHSTSDDSFAYRSKKEVEDWKRRDSPISRMRKWMEKRQWWNEDMEKEARSQLRRKVLSEFSSAEKAPKPELHNMFGRIFDEPSPVIKEQIKELGELLDTYPDEFDLSTYHNGRDGLKDKDN